jgi:hypothetical protein
VGLECEWTWIAHTYHLQQKRKKIYQESQGNDKGNKNPTPEIGCQHNNLKGDEANPPEEMGKENLLCNRGA